MKRLIFLLSLFLSLTINLNAQLPSYEIENSFQKAKEQDKYVLLVFSGSDWCKPCIQLKQDILSDNDFTEYSFDLLLIHFADFPYKRKNKLSKAHEAHNFLLSERYNKEGVFPKLLLFDQDQNLVIELNYNKGMSTKAFINQIDSKIKKQ